MARNSIPTYSLYGEFSDNPGPDWIHCETIQARSRLHNYTIQPHRHERLFQILHLTSGEAEIVIDGQSSIMRGPFIVALPPMAVHGYSFSPDVGGTVLTLFENRLAPILEPLDGIKDSFGSVRMVSLHEHEAAARAIAADIAALASEFAGREQGRLKIIEARLTLVLVTLHRLLRPERPVSRDPGERALQHIMRFRRIVDRDFRSRKPLEAYARQLGLSATHLNRICREHLGDSALGVIHQRIVLEAKRYLTFTNLSAKEVALALAFDDPAYFTRFFKQKTGLSPLAFRSRQKSTMG